MATFCLRFNFFLTENCLSSFLFLCKIYVIWHTVIFVIWHTYLTSHLRIDYDINYYKLLSCFFVMGYFEFCVDCMSTTLCSSTPVHISLHLVTQIFALNTLSSEKLRTTMSRWDLYGGKTVTVPLWKFIYICPCWNKSVGREQPLLIMVEWTWSLQFKQLRTHLCFCQWSAPCIKSPSSKLSFFHTYIPHPTTFWFQVNSVSVWPVKLVWNGKVVFFVLGCNIAHTYVWVSPADYNGIYFWVRSMTI